MAAETESVAVPEAGEVFGPQYRRFTQLVGELRAANEVKKQAEAEAKRLNNDLKLMWADVEAKTVTDEGARVTLVQSSNSTINKEKLLELGVTATVIRDATKTTTYTYVLVTEGKS
jgi:hypothetical protein